MIEQIAAIAANGINPAYAATGLAFAVAIVCAVRGYRGVACAIASVAASDAARALLAPLYNGSAKPYNGDDLRLWLVFGILPLLIPPMVYLWVGARIRAPWLPAVLLAMVWCSYPALRGQLLLDAILSLYAVTYIAVVSTRVVSATRNGATTTEDMMLITLGLTGLASISILRVFMDRGWNGVPITYSVGLLAVAVQALLGGNRKPPQVEQARRVDATS